MNDNRTSRKSQTKVQKQGYCWRQIDVINHVRIAIRFHLIALSCVAAWTTLRLSLLWPRRTATRSRQNNISWIRFHNAYIPFRCDDWSMRASLLGGAREESEGVAAMGEARFSTAIPSETKSNSIYSMPALYDLAFGYRNYEEEVQFLLAAHNAAVVNCVPCAANADTSTVSMPSTPESVRILEVAAGPARHSIVALQSFAATQQIFNIESESSSPFVEHVTCLDLSPQMLQYAQSLAQEELTIEQHQSPLLWNYVLGDMRTFTLPADTPPFDSAWILLGSLQMLTTNDEVIQCFQCIAAVLKDYIGTLILELPHPAENLFLVECTRNEWTIPLQDVASGEEAGTLHVLWGNDDDEFDPVKQIRQCTVSMEWSGPGSEALTAQYQSSSTFNMDTSQNLVGLQSNNKINRKDRQRPKSIKKITNGIREIVPMRIFSAQEIDALARCSGMRVVAMYGAMDETVSVYDEDTAFRLICVLRKTSPSP